MTGEPPRGRQGPGCRPEGTNGEIMDVVNGDRCRHRARGAEMSDGGWRVAGVGDVQADSVPLRDRRGGAGDKGRCATTLNGC